MGWLLLAGVAALLGGGGDAVGLSAALSGTFRRDVPLGMIGSATGAPATAAASPAHVASAGWDVMVTAAALALAACSCLPAPPMVPVST